MTEMDITYMFIRYISVTVKRQASAFHRRYNRISYHENREFNENLETKKGNTELYPSLTGSFYRTFEEKLLYQELITKGLKSLNDAERYLIFEKFMNQRSDNDTGKELSVSSQMISKRKRKILNKLEKIFFF
ncbi:sigma-70 family RNA polymerase sigma factor [Enterococcus faecium]|uniref:sigma-70 family RNA polymerase sigma factor n=1 Tax=Enterococcus faecium TaxID=1352 RepID=UPI0011062E23|nr:sigma-70 family RNA polymerase sigma factor [Enterococcus faecium]